MKIEDIRTLLLIFIAGIFFTSCQKEVGFQDLNNGSTPGGGNGGGTNNINITGDWNFVGSSAKTYAAISLTEAGQTIKSITTSEYETQNNQGTLQVTDKQFIFKGITHSVDDMAHSVTYLNGILFAETDAPFQAVYPVTDQTMDYVRNTNDSLTFSNAFALVPDLSGSGGTAPVPTGPMGAKINLSNDTLTLILNYKAIETIVQQGVPATFEARVEGISKYKKR